MKKSILVILIVILLAGLFMSGCSSSADKVSAAAQSVDSVSSTTGKIWKLRFGYEQSPASYNHLYIWEPWAQEVEKATKGRVKIELFPSQTLFKTTDAVNAVQTGITDLGFVIPANFPGMYPLIDVAQLPFNSLTSHCSSQVVWNLYQKYPEIQKMYSDFKLVSIWTTDSMYLHSAGKNYKTLADFRGQQIRTSAGASTDLVNLLGANAVFMGMGDVYVNLQKGVIDALIVSSEGALGFRIYEVAPYQTHFPGVKSVHSIIMNKKIWNEMPADVQAEFDSVSGFTLCQKCAAVADKASVDMPALCQNAGVTLHEYTVPNDELADWVKTAGGPMSEAWLKKAQKAGLTNGRQILDDMIGLSQQYQ